MTFNIYSNEKFAELIFNWIQEEEDEEFSVKDLGKSVVDLIIDMELADRGISNADETMRKQIQKKLAEKNKVVPRISGNQTVGQEAIHKLLIEDFEGGVDLILNNIQERESYIKEYISATQSKRAQKPRSNPLNDVLDEMLEENINITEPEVIELLEGAYSRDVYIEDHNEGITIEKNGVVIDRIPISGLKNRLYRRRFKIRCN